MGCCLGRAESNSENDSLIGFGINVTVQPGFNSLILSEPIAPTLDRLGTVPCRCQIDGPRIDGSSFSALGTRRRSHPKRFGEWSLQIDGAV